MPVRMVSAIVVSLLSGAVAPAYPCAVDQAHAGTTEASVVRRTRGIIRCILNCLLSIVAGFVWRVERGGVNTTITPGPAIPAPRLSDSIREIVVVKKRCGVLSQEDPLASLRYLRPDSV